MTIYSSNLLYIVWRYELLLKRNKGDKIKQNNYVDDSTYALK